ncbi:MAG TPA: CCA tRNA nucleotidyltransferase [Thermoguttaceae bacterium]|nr:CCA tRNA nucleotidyltransferase [Thermoguttaceae bacterium]
MTVPEQQRRFAAEVVRRLRDAGFVAYWAGGCVRDQLLGRVPKDYDVATNATPPQIRLLFGRKRTLAIGAAFGVITVIGPKPAGMIEVATFREDAAYSDGRHPDHVTFSSAEEDALRRDFTINGLFYDPIGQEVLDFVGGREDLAAKLIRAIGQPRQRIGEDKLRMLRAVRFAATFGFELHPDTLAAIREMASQITVVSAERIAMEMRRLLVEPRRAEGVGMMIDAGLADAVLPEVVPHDQTQRRRLDHTLGVLARLSQPGFPLALGTLLHESTDPAGAREACRRWRLSNKETDRVAWLVENQAALENARSMRFSALQPLLVAEGIEDLLALHDALALDSEAAAYCRSLLAQPREVLDPPPLLTGDDLIEHGISPGPRFRDLLQRVRDAQLDEEIRTKEEALAMVDRLLNE